MTSLQAWPRADDLRREIRDHGRALLPGLLSRDEAARVASATSSLPTRRAYRGNTGVTFDSQALGPGSELYDLFQSAPMVCTARAGLGLPEGAPVQRLIGWIHRYKVGEYIPPHRDVSGDIQLVVSLHQPPPENGGTLFVADVGGLHPVPLSTGDALLFVARELTHYSVALVPTIDNPRPVKVVAVGRYHF